MRYFIYLAYDGTNYHGWQIQPNGMSVQEALMRALSTFLRKKIEVVGAGRTDAGVHARLMVAHFDFEKELDGEQITDKLNRNRFVIGIRIQESDLIRQQLLHANRRRTFQVLQLQFTPFKSLIVFNFCHQ